MLEAVIRAPIINKSIQRAAIAFVDDTNFYINGRNYRNKIQRMLDIYIALYEATGGAIQQDKSYMYE